MTKHSFNPQVDIPDLSGKVILVTGGNSGIGLATCINLSKHNPKHLYIASRSEEKAAAAISVIADICPNLSVTFLPVDLSSFASVKACAQSFIAQESTLNILICNAGIMAAPPGLTVDGYEIQFGTNYLGHALLTRLLLPTLKETAENEEVAGNVRIVNVSSAAAQIITPPEGIVFDKLKTRCEVFGGFSPRWKCYGQSKLAQVMYSQQLAKELVENNIQVIAVHPGRVVEGSGLSDRLHPWDLWSIMDTVSKPVLRLTADQGSWNVLWAATAPNDKISSGEFYFPVGETTVESINKALKSRVVARKLWEWTERELEGHSLEDCI